MLTITYNKLVRDRIPEIIQSTGKQCETQVLCDSEYLEKLDEKLVEELQESQESKSLEELADIMEVIYAVAVARGYTLQQLESVRAEKAKSRGGFEHKIMLKNVVTDD